jgi:histidinol-phosphate/aromatic aminotransferase/cobyric acid decarboxylase-like protein
MWYSDSLMLLIKRGCNLSANEILSLWPRPQPTTFTSQYFQDFGVNVAEVWIGNGFTEHLQNVTTNNYDILTELRTPNIIVTTAHRERS